MTTSVAAAPTTLLFLDFETFYDTKSGYTLRKISIPQYILDPRFAVIMCSVRELDLATNTWKAHVVDGPDFGAFIAGYDPTTTVTVTFNALFDNSILGWVYGWVPKRMIDPMGMARALLGHKLNSFSLASVALYLLGRSKLTTITKVDGMTRDQIIAAGLWKEFCTYALWDVDACFDIFAKLAPTFPEAEFRIMDLVLRCAVQPKFQLDHALLTSHLQETRDQKKALMASAGITDDASLLSQKQFTDLLVAQGVVIEYKTSPAGKQIPALARTDQFMADLQDDPRPAVQALACARIGIKSTLEETRCLKLLDIANLPWSHYRNGNPRLGFGGEMPIPLRYAGAHTHRLSGDWGLNMQNLPRGSKLRKALIAPKGYKVITCDLSQIEARLVAWICGCTSLLNSFKAGDPYSDFASLVFGFKVDKKLHPVHRFIGKTGVLGLGYGCGSDKFFTMVTKSARLFGIDLAAIGGFTEAQAKDTVNTYRQKYSPIKTGWHTLDYMLKYYWLPASGTETAFGPVKVGHGYVLLPNYLSLLYSNMRVDAAGEMLYDFGRFTHKMYGAKFLENIVQALARIIVMNAALRLADRGYLFVLQAHDELVFLVPDEDVDNVKVIIHTEMTRCPSWARDLPLGAEVGVGLSYGEAK